MAIEPTGFVRRGAHRANGTDDIRVATRLTGVKPLSASLQKSELLHLHSLFAESKRHLEHRGPIDGPLEPYESMSVRPTHAHRSKDRHREAVIALASAIGDELAVNSKYADDEASETGDDGASETRDGHSDGDSHLKRDADVATPDW